MLVLSRKIAEAIVLPDHNTTITVLSVSGQTVRLGITAPPRVAIHREEIWNKLREWHAPNLPNGRSLRVILADADDPLFRECQRRIETPQLQLCQARTGIECLSLMRADPADLLVIGRGLLWGDAEGVLECLREKQGLSGAVLALGVRAREACLQLASADLWGWLPEPITPSALSAKLHEFVTRCRPKNLDKVSCRSVEGA